MLMNKEIDTNRFWGYQELAMHYFPHVKPRCATGQLRRWIVYNGVLQSRLEACGWTPGQKVFTPQQVRCIVEHLG